MSEPAPKRQRFDINEGAGIDNILLPPLTDGQMIVEAFSADTYQQVFDNLNRNIDENGFHQAIKALAGSQFEPMPEALAKALGVPPSTFAYSRINYMPDPNASGILPWPGIAPEALGKIARENVAPQLIIGMRCDDILRYSGLSTHPWRPGWRLETTDPTETLRDGGLQEMRQAERFILTSNIETGYAQARVRDAKRLTGFQRFLSAGTRDWLTYDGLAIWTDMDNQGKVKAYTLLPAGNIRLATSKGYEQKPEQFAVGVDEGGKVIQAFTRDQLTFLCRNPRTNADVSGDLYSAGYGLSEIEIAVRLIQGFQNVIDLNVDAFNRSCCSEDTEVLTKNGWRSFGEVQAGVDEFATLNLDTGDFEYQKATLVIWQDYVGEMYAVESRTMDFLVTPEHRIITQYRPDQFTKDRAPYEVTRAAALFDKFQHMTPASRTNYCAPIISAWKGTEIDSMAFDRHPVRFKMPAQRISGDDYCAFMGMYLSEGNLKWGASGKFNIEIHQQRTSKGFGPFKELLSRILGKEPYYFEAAHRFCFGWRGLAEHIEQFGKDCYSKRIPQSILNATPRQQKIFWDFYCLGDGYIAPNKIVSRSHGLGRQHIATTSRVMADQLQELAQKMGYAATIQSVDAAEYVSEINGKALHSAAIRHDVYLKRSPMASFDLRKTRYAGKIGCASVPNGTLYIRRNGKACWTGNSVPPGILTVTGVTQRQLDFINRLWTNIKKGITKKWAMPVIGMPTEKSKIELIDLSQMEGKEGQYKEWMNMLAGAFCTIYRFPVRRLGYRISGHGKDSEPLPDSAVEMIDEDDPGLAPLLGHWETAINEYLLWSRYPHFRFKFTGANPKEDARQYEWRRNSQTWDETRVASGLKKLVDTYPEEHKVLAEIMGAAPIDANLSATYRTLAAPYIQMKVGGNVGRDANVSGSITGEKTDPAKSEKHGHTSGVRRDSAAESNHQ